MGFYFFRLLGSLNVNFSLGNGIKEKMHKRKNCNSNLVKAQSPLPKHKSRCYSFITVFKCHMAHSLPSTLSPESILSLLRFCFRNNSIHLIHLPVTVNNILHPQLNCWVEEQLFQIARENPLCIANSVEGGQPDLVFWSSRARHSKVMVSSHSAHNSILTGNRNPSRAVELSWGPLLTWVVILKKYDLFLRLLSLIYAFLRRRMSCPSSLTPVNCSWPNFSHIAGIPKAQHRLVQWNSINFNS